MRNQPCNSVELRIDNQAAKEVDDSTEPWETTFVFQRKSKRSVEGRANKEIVQLRMRMELLQIYLLEVRWR